MMGERALRRLRTARGHGYSRLLGSALLLHGATLSLRLLGYRRTLGWIRTTSRTPRSAGTHPIQPVAIDHLVRSVRLAARLDRRRFTCLPQACALYWLLARRGLDPRIRFGLCTSQPQPAAHAWVELDGAPIGESADPSATYAALGGDRLDAP